MSSPMITDDNRTSNKRRAEDEENGRKLPKKGEEGEDAVQILDVLPGEILSVILSYVPRGEKWGFVDSCKTTRCFDTSEVFYEEKWERRKRVTRTPKDEDSGDDSGSDTDIHMDQEEPTTEDEEVLSTVYVGIWMASQASPTVALNFFFNKRYEPHISAEYYLNPMKSSDIILHYLYQCATLIWDKHGEAFGSLSRIHLRSLQKNVNSDDSEGDDEEDEDDMGYFTIDKGADALKMTYDIMENEYGYQVEHESESRLVSFKGITLCDDRLEKVQVVVSPFCCPLVKVTLRADFHQLRIEMLRTAESDFFRCYEEDVRLADDLESYLEQEYESWGNMAFFLDYHIQNGPYNIDDPIIIDCARIALEKLLASNPEVADYEYVTIATLGSPLYCEDIGGIRTDAYAWNGTISEALKRILR